MGTEGKRSAPLSLSGFESRWGISRSRHGRLAQLVERLPCKQDVGGSSPPLSTRSGVNRVSTSGRGVTHGKSGVVRHPSRETPMTRCSSVGRAPALGAGGRRFEPCYLDEIADERSMRFRPAPVHEERSGTVRHAARGNASALARLSRSALTRAERPGGSRRKRTGAEPVRTDFIVGVVAENRQTLRGWSPRR